MRYIGLHLDGSVFRLALIHKRKGQIEIKTLTTTNTLIPDTFIGKKIEITTGLRAQDILLRKIDVPLIKQKAVRAALPFQIESHMPYPIDQLILNTSLHVQGQECTQARIIAGHQDKIRQHLEMLDKQSLRPGWVSCYPQALYRFCRYYFPQIDHCIVLYFGSEETSLIGVVNGELQIASSFAIGANDFIALWNKQHPQEELPDNLSEIFSQSNSALQSLKDRFFKEIDRSIHFIKSKCKTALHGNLVPLGQFDLFFSTEYFQQQNLQLYQSKHAVYAVAIGLALDTTVQDERSIQFLQRQFTPTTHLARLGKKLCISLCMAALMACFTHFATQQLLSQQTQSLEQKIMTYCQSWAAKDSLASNLLQQTKSHTSIDGIEDRVAGIKQTIGRYKNFFPVEPPHWKVSDLLMYLSTAPLLQNCIIESVNYQMVKYPLIGKRRLPYQIVVDLQLSISNSTLAKQIQDDLQNQHYFIDPSQEFRWQRTKSGYSAKFYLCETN